VEDLAGLRVAFGVEGVGLGGGQIGESAAGDGGFEPQQLKHGNNAIPSEDGGEPRHTGVRVGAIRRRGNHHGQIGARAAEPDVALHVGGMDQSRGKRTALAFAGHGSASLVPGAKFAGLGLLLLDAEYGERKAGFTLRFEMEGA